MNIFMFFVFCLVYYFAVVALNLLVKDYLERLGGALFFTTIAVAIGIFVKPLLYLCFISTFVNPLLPFELNISYWNMVVICFALVMLDLKINYKKD